VLKFNILSASQNNINKSSFFVLYFNLEKITIRL
jgi:hypothetical protein